MSTPNVTLVELDGALGTLPADARMIAVVGVCDAGPIDTPAAFARTKDIVSNFSGGPAVEAATYWIKNYDRPALMVRTGNTVVGTHDNLDVTGVTGTSVVTISSGDTNPNDDYEPYFKVIAGGTIGTTGITFQWSLDGGRTLSPVTALDTANSFVFPGSGGIGYSFAAGTLVAGDVARSRATAPNWNASELGSALDALRLSAQAWDLCHIVGPIDATAFDTIATSFAAMPEKMWMGSVRMPTPGESEATYLSSLSTAFAAKANNFGMLCAGAAKTVSAVSFRQYRRPAGFAICSRLGGVSEELDIADINLGSLPGVEIRDVNGNPDEHDEFINPGLDDARFTVLRTWSDVQGVYVNNPRIFSAAGSDFEFAQHRRVMNRAKRALRLYMQRRLSKSIRVNATTGFILETEALEIEAGADAAIRSSIMAKPMASGGGFTGGIYKGSFFKLSRTDNVLSTKTLTGQASIVPLAYPKAINLEIGFRNPALQVIAV